MCKECVQDSITRFGFINCSFQNCSKKHEFQISGLNSLFLNKGVNDLIENHLKSFTEYYVDELKEVTQYKKINNKKGKPNQLFLTFFKIFKGYN